MTIASAFPHLVDLVEKDRCGVIKVQVGEWGVPVPS